MLAHCLLRQINIKTTLAEKSSVGGVELLSGYVAAGTVQSDVKGGAGVQ